jgi:hypothetical protein
MIFTPKVAALGEPTATVRFIPGTTDVYTVGETFTVACVVEDAGNLSGFDVQIAWDTTYLNYVTHTLTAPVETYNTPQTPSPYAGIIHSPPLPLQDTVDAVAGTYWAAFATLGGPGFDGDGTVFIMTFSVLLVPYDYEIAPDTYVDTLLTFTNIALARSTGAGGGALNYVSTDGIVRIHAQSFEYPPEPLLKLADSLVGIEPGTPTLVGTGACNNFNVDVMLLSKDPITEEYIGVSAFWEVQGVDIYVNFNTTLLEAVSYTIDPDGDFGAFWTTLFIVAEEIDNTAGFVHVAFLGIPPRIGPPVNGIINLLEIEFHELYDSEDFPPPTELIYLENPNTIVSVHGFDSLEGLIDLADPVGTTWHELFPNLCTGPLDLTSWADNGDGLLGTGDEVIIDDGLGCYYSYEIFEVSATLNVNQLPFAAIDDYVWVASFGEDNLGYNGLPGRYIGTDNPYNGFGVPYWTGNFSTAFPVSSVNSITVHALPFGPGYYNYTLTEGVDYLVHADDDLIELLNPVDVPVINEMWTDGVDNSLNGWPWINYVASGIQSVFVDMHNGTARFGRNFGYAQPPPSEWWYDPDWAWELEGWWALGYYCPASYCWPAGSTWWINYTAASYLTIDYNADPFPDPIYLEHDYTNFLTTVQAAPLNSTWTEAAPDTTRGPYTITGWTDEGDGMLGAGDSIWMNEPSMGNTEFVVNDVGTDLLAGRIAWVVDDPCTDRYFGWETIIDLASEVSDREFSPWNGKPYSVRLPHFVENLWFQAFFKPPGAWIDIFTPDRGGEGPGAPSDMFWPQKEVTICAYVTYNFWPEQQKDVAFHIYMPDGMGGLELYAVLYNKTNAEGLACITFRLPWPCYDWPDVIGVWRIEAFVDVACIVVNDTLEFHYDYLVNIMDVAIDGEAFKHCEDIPITVYFSSHWQGLLGETCVTITVTILDETGVPFGYAEADVWLTGAVFCQAKGYEVTFNLHVVKWARAGIATIWAGSLECDTGAPAGPVLEPPPTVGILAEWA